MKVPKFLNIKQEDYPKTARETKELARIFTREYPDYPLIIVKIKYGEAYLAPTEHIIHDGYSIGKHSLDLFLTYLGYFL